MSKEIIDVHIHFGAPQDTESGCYWSEEFENGVAFFAFRLMVYGLFRKVDLKHIKKHMLRVITKSKHVDKSVLLAMDQVYDEDGNVHDQNSPGVKTHLYVPNRYLANLARENDRILFGASVHPYRPDWENELQYCLDNKAVLCKWVPSSQQIDLMHTKCEAFYNKLAANNLPLLCHVGPEAAIPPYDEGSQKLNDPKLLEKALGAGVTVIAAHAALPLLPPPFQSEQPYLDLVDLFREGESKGWKLYADLSAINLGPRGQYIDRLKNDIPPNRLIFGSDYPIPILDISQNPHISLGLWLKHFFETITIQNPLDKNYRLIKNMDFDEALFYNASNILRIG